MTNEIMKYLDTSKTKDKKMSKQYTLIIEKDEDGWFVSEVVELPGCHTQAKTMNQLIDRTKEAIQAYLETDPTPEISEAFIGVQQIEV